MAHTSSQRKRIRQDAKRKDSNKSFKSSMKTAIKKFLVANKNGDSNALDLLNFANKKIDKAVTKKLIHRNNGSRKKSQLAIAAKNK